LCQISVIGQLIDFVAFDHAAYTATSLKRNGQKALPGARPFRQFPRELIRQSRGKRSDAQLICRRELVDLDSQRAHILLPVERVKNKRQHLVPLVGLGLATVTGALELSSGSDWLFVGGHDIAVALLRSFHNRKENGGVD
jgi:hypothetical protein